jgi:transglutaminase-like putative cysteine protease
MDRRDFLKNGMAATTGLALGARPLRAGAATPGWRAFEVVTRIDIDPSGGATRAWVPVPLLTATDYFERRGDTWTGNAGTAKALSDDRYGVGFVYAEWPAGAAAPALEVTSRFAARDRQVDLGAAGNGRADDPKTLALYLEPTKLIPTDGIVRETAAAITKGRERDVDKARAIYDWIVETTFRDPKVRGCGLGDVKTMLETRNFGGKCADLNALFVGLARAVGVPARDVYGIRVADSAEFKSLGRSGDVSKAQHCRAEFHAQGPGWVPVDPADVRKLVLEEPPAGLPLTDPVVRRAREKLFGAWEMNWLPYNYGHDLALLHSTGAPVPFLMYPQAETDAGRKDSLDPATFRYRITATEIPA